MDLINNIYIIMSTLSELTISIEKLFLRRKNVEDLSKKLGRNALTEMRTWVKKFRLDDCESVRSSYAEVLAYLNSKFISEHKADTIEMSLADGRKYPKYYIADSVEGYFVNDYRAHDAQCTPDVFRTNENFRYGNAIKKWETSLYKRHYDRDEHVHGLGDTRELSAFQRGYNMHRLYKGNEYESSDSMMYDYN
jgi:hypothetical protein